MKKNIILLLLIVFLGKIEIAEARLAALGKMGKLFLQPAAPSLSNAWLELENTKETADHYLKKMILVQNLHPSLQCLDGKMTNYIDYTHPTIARYIYANLSLCGVPPRMKIVINGKRFGIITQ